MYIRTAAVITECVGVKILVVNKWWNRFGIRHSLLGPVRTLNAFSPNVVSPNECNEELCIHLTWHTVTNNEQWCISSWFWIAARAGQVRRRSDARKQTCENAWIWHDSRRHDAQITCMEWCQHCLTCMSTIQAVLAIDTSRCKSTPCWHALHDVTSSAHTAQHFKCNAAWHTMQTEPSNQSPQTKECFKPKINNSSRMVS